MIMEITTRRGDIEISALRYARATSGYWISAQQHGKPIALCAKWPVRFALSRSIQ